MKNYTTLAPQTHPELGFSVDRFQDLTAGFKEFLKDDRADGVKKTSYSVYRQLGIITAYDTEDVFLAAGRVLYDQDYTEYRAIDKEIGKGGVRKVRLHVFTIPEELRTEDNHNNDMGFFLTSEGLRAVDSVSIHFDYIPGAWDHVIAEVWFAPKAANGGSNMIPKKKKRK